MPLAFDQDFVAGVFHAPVGAVQEVNVMPVAALGAVYSVLTFHPVVLLLGELLTMGQRFTEKEDKQHKHVRHSIINGTHGYLLLLKSGSVDLSLLAVQRVIHAPQQRAEQVLGLGSGTSPFSGR